MRKVAEVKPKRGRPFGSVIKKERELPVRHIQEAPPLPNIDIIRAYEPPVRKPVAYTGRLKKEKDKEDVRKKERKHINIKTY